MYTVFFCFFETQYKRGARAGLPEPREDSEEGKLICHPIAIYIQELKKRKKKKNTTTVSDYLHLHPHLHLQLLHLVTVSTVSVVGPRRSGRRVPERHRGFDPPPYTVPSCPARPTGGPPGWGWRFSASVRRTFGRRRQCGCRSPALRTQGNPRNPPFRSSVPMSWRALSRFCTMCRPWGLCIPL